MKLVVHELSSSLTQELTTPDRVVTVYAVRPHLLKWLEPAGTLKMQVLTSGDVLVGESEEIEISDINDANYFHGYVRFNVNAQLEPSTTYKFKLVATDYTFDESAYVGWCGDFDLSKYDRDYVPSGLIDCPLDMEIWEKTRK